MSNLESTINSIRDILRKDGVTGMDSINHCIVFLISRILDPQLCEKFDIDEKYAFDNLLQDEDGEEIGDQDLKAKIINKSGNNLIHAIVNKLGFKNIKFKLESPQNLRLIYNKLKDLDVLKLSNNYDLIGTIYEIHLKSGTSNSMRDLGQYYTHRLVINYMIKLCDPVMKNGIIEKIVDPTMGTGGFLTMSIKYLNEKYKNKINWKKNKDNIIGFDIDDNVKNMATLNVLLEIGELCKDTLVKQDTLHNDMQFKDGKFDGTILEKADVILANEPMGLKSLKFAEFCDRIKELKISGTKAEPAFLQLFMSALNDNGRCAVIVPDGVLFNESSQHKSTRQYLVENFNLLKVVSLNDDFFLNTGVKTSILFFKKDGNITNEVEFSDIKLNNSNVEETCSVKVKYDDIVKNKYSLFVNKYNTTEVDKIEGIAYKKLGDIGKFCSGVKCSMPDEMFCNNVDNPKYIRINNLSNYKISGEYKYLSDSGIAKTLNNRFSKNDIYFSIVGTVGLCGIVNDEFVNSVHSGNIIRMINIKDIDKKYLIYYLTTDDFRKKLHTIISTTTQPATSINKVENIEIPIPSITIQKLIVEKLDVLNNCIEQSTSMIDNYRKIIKYYVECQIGNSNEYKLDDICNMHIGKKTTKEMTDEGDYDFYNGSADAPVGKLKDYSYENTKPYVLLIKDGGAGQGKYGEKIGLGKSFYVNGKTAFTTSVVALINNNDKFLNTKYLYYYMSCVKNELMDLAQYTTGLGHLTTGRLKEFCIKIPSKEKQEEIVKYCDNLSNLILQINQQINNNQELMKNIMDNYLNSQEIDVNEQSDKQEDTENNDVDTEIDQTTESVQLEKKPTKKKSTSIKKVEPEKTTESVQLEKKPTKKKAKTPVVEDAQEEIIADEYEWDTSVLKTMSKHKEKNDENKKILTKLRKDNNIDTDTFWNKIKDLRKDGSVAQKTK